MSLVLVASAGCSKAAIQSLSANLLTATATPSATPSAAPSPGPSASHSPAPSPTPSSSPVSASCKDSTSLLCDDFETGAINKAVWNVMTHNGGTVAVDSQHVYDGKFALHVHIEPQAVSQAMILETKTFPTTATNLYGRAMVYASAVTPEDHTDLVNAFVGGAGLIEYGVTGALHELATHWYINGSEKGLAGAKMPVDTWYCLEWNLNGGAGTDMIWLNGALLSGATQTGIAKQTFSSMEIGLELYADDSTNAPHGYDFWYDAIEIGTARIGCPAP